jgi:hypothetical protein
MTEQRFASWTIDHAAERWERQRSMREWVLFGAGSGGAILGTAFLLFLTSGLRSWTAVALIPIAFAGAAYLILLRLDRLRSRPATEMKALWGDQPHDGVSEWTVRLSIVQEHVRTGTDTGKVWVQPGAICFVGKRTSFALSSMETGGRFSVDLVTSGWLEGRQSVRIKLVAVGRTTNWWVELRPQRSQELTGLCYAVGRFVLADQPPSNLRQFPPTSPGLGRQHLPVATFQALTAACVSLIASWGMVSPLGWFASHFYWEGQPIQMSQVANATVSSVLWLGVFLVLARPAILVLCNYHKVMKQ